MSHTDRPRTHHSNGRAAANRRQGSARSLLAGTLTVLLVVITVVLTTLALEAATRFIYRDITTTGDNRSYFARLWREQNPPLLNTHGFRERNFSVPHSRDIYRIAVIGDSITYGQGVSEEDRMTNILEGFMNANHSGLIFEALNFGWPGTDTVDHIGFLVQTVVGMQPDFVLLQWFINDVRNDQNLRHSTIPLVPWSRLHRAMLRHSALFYLTDYGWIQLQNYLGLSESYADFMLTHFRDADGWRAKRAQELLLNFIEICRRNRLSLGIVLFPALQQEQPLGFLLNRVLKVCADQQIRCVDLRNTFASVDDSSTLWVNQFDHHPNRHANELAARAVLDAFGAEWAAEADERLTKMEPRE
jgi:hypothetical protein